MTVQKRQSRIRESITSISSQTPETKRNNAFWYMPDRGNPNYYRFVDDDKPRYDVWIETDSHRDKIGDLHISIEVVIYDVQMEHEIQKETVVNKVFDGHQPSEQAFLMNVYHYENQAREHLENFVDYAEHCVAEE
jgi:hypothetical protein